MQTLIIKSKFSDAVAALTSHFSKLDDSGSCFILCSTEYDKDNCVRHDFLDIIEHAISIGYGYVNTIVYPTANAQNVSFTDNVRYVVWLCKSKVQMKFNKDFIREKHIWKDVEWGKREKNYNPKGKDPGNVWIPTEDDGQAHITNHILLSDDEVIDKLLKMSCCFSDYCIIDTVFDFQSTPNTFNVHKQSSDVSPTGKIFFKSSESMPEINDSSVDIVVTSPPYWNLKDYFKQGQIGQESYDKYIARIKTVFQQCHEKLKDSGSLWVNINIRVTGGNVILIPRDYVTICKEIGFYYKGIIIWHKSSGIPTGDKNIVDRHEYILLFSKNCDFFIDNAIFSGYSDYKNSFINGGAFWNINRKAGSVGKQYIHPAIYPNELVSRVIRIASPKGGLVMDPFLGSGTSLIASLSSGMSFVGYEYNECFKELMEHRFGKELSILSNSSIQFFA